MSCQAAMPLAARAAVNTVLDRIACNEPTPLGQSFAGSNISIGRRYGTIQLAHSDDTPRSFYVGGKMAATIKTTGAGGLTATPLTIAPSRFGRLRSMMVPLPRLSRHSHNSVRLDHGIP